MRCLIYTNWAKDSEKKPKKTNYASKIYEICHNKSKNHTDYAREYFKLINHLFSVKRRYLNQNEKQMVFSIFGESLTLDHIEIIAHRLVLKHYAISPNGNVYFHPEDWCEDFSQCSLAKRAWLIHELTHVWQLQQGISVVRKALFDRQYSYVLEQGKQFLHYGVEQQASIVQDYFMRRSQGKSCEAYEDCIPFLQSSTV